MDFLKPPKLMQWEPSIPQHYSTDKKVLLVSGCSFTANTNQLEYCASWPGFVLDRCRFDRCWDLSYPGVGNEFISDGIRKHLDHQESVTDYFVIIMWSGLNRTTKTKDKHESAELSANIILDMWEYLQSRSIPAVFTQYTNMLFPPFLPKRDITHEFPKYVSKETLDRLNAIPWIPTDPMDFLFEYAFRKDMLAEDMFHPGLGCSESWTDNILLPNMLKQGLITKWTNT